MTPLQMIEQAPCSEKILQAGRCAIYRLCAPKDLGNHISCNFAFAMNANDVFILSFDEVAQLAKALPMLMDSGAICAEIPKQVWKDAVKAKEDAKPNRPVCFC